MSEGVENCIKGLSVKVCWFQYFSCRNSHRFMMCTMTAEKSDCNSLLDSLSLDDPLVTKNRVGGFFLAFCSSVEEHPYKFLTCWGPVQC